MDTIITNEMGIKIKNIYSTIDENTRSWNIKVKKTRWRNEDSKNSYSFDIEGIDNSKDKLSDIAEYLKQIFKIDEGEVKYFDRAIRQVCSGNGNESEKITVLRSSSLCCLLNFYNVQTVPIVINIDGSNIRFNKAFFEVQNEVIKNKSNIDVVLISEDRKHILFLESKFAEYYLNNGQFDISTQYLDYDISKEFYKKDVLELLNFRILYDDNGSVIEKTDNDGNKFFTVDSEKTIDGKYKGYVEGIKQMVSHYIGVNNFLKGEKIIEKLNETFILDEDAQVYLGEILFDFPDGSDMSQYLKDYEEKYKKLQKQLTYNKSIKILPSILYYSSYNERLNDVIRRFYYGEKQTV